MSAAALSYWPFRLNNDWEMLDAGSTTKDKNGIFNNCDSNKNNFTVSNGFVVNDQQLLRKCRLTWLNKKKL